MIGHYLHNLLAHGNALTVLAVIALLLLTGFISYQQAVRKPEPSLALDIWRIHRTDDGAWWFLDAKGKDQGPFSSPNAAYVGLCHDIEDRERARYEVLGRMLP